MQKLPALMLTFLTTERLLVAILVISSLLGISGYSSDVFMHLVTGRHILTITGLPTGDPFSFTNPGEGWVMHEWFYQLVLYLLFDAFGMAGLKIVGTGLLVATLYFNKKNCQTLGASLIVAWATTIGLLVTWNQFIGVRPQAITYFFFVLYLNSVLRYRYLHDIKGLYLLPLLMLVWVNSHGGFMAGIVLLAYMLLLHVIETRLTGNGWHLDRPLLVTLIVTTAVSLINPNGYEQLMFPFQLVDQWAIRYVTEWQAPRFTEWPYAIYLVVVSIFLMSSLFWVNKERWYRLALTLPFIVASLQAVRHIPLADFVFAPYLATQIEDMVAAWKVRMTPGETRRELGRVEYLFNWAVLACYGVAVAALYPVYSAATQADIARRFPIGATNYLIENNVHGRLFAPMEYSSYILFTRYPEQKVFYDVRIDRYGAAISKHYMIMVNALDGWQNLFKYYAIDYVVLDKSKPLYTAISSEHRFSLSYEDATSAVFLLKNSPDSKLASTLS